MTPISVQRALARHSYLRRMAEQKEAEQLKYTLRYEKKIDHIPVFDRGNVLGESTDARLERLRSRAEYSNPFINDEIVEEQDL